MMHTETTTTATERYITTHRARIAVVLALALVLVVTGGAAFTLPLLGIISANMVTAIGVLSLLGGTVAAIAVYWGTE